MIFEYKTDLMRRVAHLAAHGYTRWTSGVVEPKKLQALEWKFADRYGTEFTRQQRYRAGQRKEARAHFLSQADGQWLLLVTAEGGGLVTEIEQLQRAESRNGRITLTGYELVRRTRKGQDSPSWTWRITKESEEDWVSRIKEAARHKRDDKMRQVMHSLARVPGFSESRRQAFKLAKYAQNEWKRARSDPWPFQGFYVGWLGQHTQAKTIDPKKLRKGG